jgi:2-keto-3-deoxy-6-phosphogluconate aldolase
MLTKVSSVASVGLKVIEIEVEVNMAEKYFPRVKEKCSGNRADDFPDESE